MPQLRQTWKELCENKIIAYAFTVTSKARSEKHSLSGILSRQEIVEYRQLCEGNRLNRWNAQYGQTWLRILIKNFFFY
jgi:hypothetical protein